MDKYEIIGSPIYKIMVLVIDTEPNTKVELKNFVFKLENGKCFELSVSGIARATNTDRELSDDDVQALNCKSLIVGEKIKQVIYEKVPNSHKGMEQYCIVLESGMCVVNLLQCGGGSVLHIEDLGDFKKYRISEWANYLI